MKLTDAARDVAFAIAKTNGHPDPEAYAADVVGNLPTDAADESVGEQAVQPAAEPEQPQQEG